MFTTRAATAVIALVLSAPLVTACGGEGSAQPSPVSTSPTPTPTPSPAVANFLLAPTPKTDVEFTTFEHMGISYDGDPATGTIVQNALLSGNSGRSKFVYDASTKTFDWIGTDATGYYEYGTIFSGKIDDWQAAHTDAKFWGYYDDNDGSDYESVFRLYKSGESNSELKLAHSGFGHVRTTGPRDGGPNFHDFWLGYGIMTQPGELPASGIENYSGVVYGFAIDAVAGKQYDLSGSAIFTLDFTELKSSGNLVVTATSTTGMQIPLGSVSFDKSDFGNVGGPTRLGPTPTGPNFSDPTFRMTVFGPTAEEIVGTFRAQITVVSGGEPIYAQGGIALKRQ